MSLNALALKPTTGDFDDIMVGVSRFTDDVWDMSAYVNRKTLNNSGKKINFSYINNCAVKTVLKQYAYYKLGKVRAATVVNRINGLLPSFVKYCELQRFSSMEEITFKILKNYVHWTKNDKELSEITCYNILSVIIEILRVGQIKGWRVPSGNFLSKMNLTELLSGRNPLSDGKKVQPIPQDVFDKILFSALHKEKDVLTKAGIIIQSQTGLRISEILEIKKGCLSTTADGYNFLEVRISKTVKGESVIHKVYANDLVRDAVLELEQATENLRNNSGLRELFLIKNKGVHNVKVRIGHTNGLKVL